MPITEFTLDELLSSLNAVGVREGDIVLMHSSLLNLGRLSEVELDDVPGQIIEALVGYLGRSGTLAALAPYYDYSNRGVPFDTRHSPVSHEVGVLNAVLANHTKAERSANPIFSIAAIGYQAEHICNGPNASAFGLDSAWDRAVRAGAKILLLGSSFQRLTIVRYIEQCAGVPYLYVKLFSTKVFRDRIELPYDVTALLRYSNLEITYDLSAFEDELSSNNILKVGHVGGGALLTMSAAECVRVGVRSLNNDIHFFLAKPPSYHDFDGSII